MIGAPLRGRHLLHLDDLLGVGLGKRPAEDREILGENIDDTAVDGAPAGDHAVAGNALLLHAEVVAAVLDEHVELLEGVLVEQQVEALAGGELALGVLGGDAPLAAAGPGLRPPLLELLEDVLHARVPVGEGFA